MTKPRRQPAEVSRSERLGRLEIRVDREGIKLMAHGTLYAVLPPTPEATPPPWLALAAAPWIPEGGLLDHPIGLLGYGGGTVARLLRGASPKVEIVGVDLDAEVLRLGRRHLKSAVRGVTIEQAEAREWLARPGPRFGAILDDLYAPKGGWLARPADLVDVPELARRRLVAGGVYAVNLRSPSGQVEKQIMIRIRRAFRQIRVIHTLEYAHKVVVATDRPIHAGALKWALSRLLEPTARHDSLLGRPGFGSPRMLGFRPMRRLPHHSNRHKT
ncbi:MAG: hypothetical protein SGI90_09925 [Candidatus Eisenbacteria bacterium]|nr:hypothetical protein [Candidatus Eisenbacteria bacterium]